MESPGNSPTAECSPAPINSRAEAEALVAEHAALTARLNKRIAEKNAEVHAAGARHDKAIQGMQQELAQKEGLLQAWAEANRKEEFGEGQSLELPRGTLWFRLGNRKVSLLRGWTWPKVLEALRANRKKFGAYIRKVEEPDTQRMLADSKPEVGKLNVEGLKEVGLSIGREERFAVTPKLDQEQV